MDDSVLTELKKKAPRWLSIWGTVVVLALAYALIAHQTSCEIRSAPTGATGPALGHSSQVPVACRPPQVLVELVDGSDSVDGPDQALQDAVDEIESALARPRSTAAFVWIIGGLIDSRVRVGPLVRLCGEGEATAADGPSASEIRTRVASRFRILRETRAFTGHTRLLEAFLAIPGLLREGRETLHASEPVDAQVVVRSDFAPRPARADLELRTADLPLGGVSVTAVVLPGRDSHPVAVGKVGRAFRSAGARFSTRDGL
jgi:hypothetical protein